MQVGIISKAYKFWQETDPVGYQILLSMASTQPKAGLINDEVSQRIEQLDQAFDRPGGVDFTQSLDILKILGSLDIVLEFYLVKRYDLAYPGASADLFSLANAQLNNPDYGAYAKSLLRRHVVFERMKILYQVFAPERSEVLVNFIQESGQNYQN